MKTYFTENFPLIKKSARMTLFLVYFYIFFEWMYCLSKSSSSYMYLIGWAQRIEVLFVDGLVVTIFALLALIVFVLIHMVITKIAPKAKCDFLLIFPSALMLACVALIGIDNFTYTVFKFGIVTTTNFLRIIYTLVFLALLYFAIKFLMKQGPDAKSTKTTFKWISAAALIVISVGFLVYGIQSRNIDLENITLASEQPSSTPNIILLSTDGLNASDMSIYGNKAITTPYLDQISSSLMVSENHFTNVGHTTGSIVTTLAGKSAFETSVLFPPDILRGSNTFEHLPAVLRSLGYTTAQVGVPYYVDANAQNLQNAFDSVNCTKYSNLRYKINRLTGYKFDDEVYLLSTTGERIADRLLHIFFIKTMVNPSKVVNQMSKFALTDVDRMQCLMENMSEAKANGQPIFVQMHLMVTHGPYFYPFSKTFSSGEKESASWMTDFVNDAVLDYDNDVKQLVDYLQENDEYDNTILVVYTDHAQHWTTTKKIPLIIHFPADQYAGELTANSQNIDIAPTILDYMGVTKPSWMEGDSLLDEVDKTRIIITANTNRQAGSETGLVAVPESNISAPFYQFSQLVAMQCQMEYSFDFDKLTVTTSTVPNYVDPCSKDELDPVEKISAYVFEKLRSYGYNVPDEWKYIN